MRCKIRLLSALLCLSAIECQSRNLHDKIDFSLDMPFDNLTEFYLDPDWLQLQLSESVYDRFGLLQDVNQNILIQDQKLFVILNQMHQGSGGGIEGNNITLSNNKGISILYGNRASNKGGAIYAEDTIKITNNSYPYLFINNLPLASKSFQSASCLYAESKICIEDNPGLVLFKNNHCQYQVNGGAIGIGGDFIIRNSGPVIFENNQAYWGGAICTGTRPDNNSPSRIYLFAERGDIVFNNNMNTDRQRNAIHSIPYTDLRIGAAKNRSVCFYDPVEHRHTTSHPCTFHPEPLHQGTVLFSGITVPRNTTFTEASLTSYFANTNIIAHGFVAVEDDACLFVHKLSQLDGTLKLGNGAIIATTNAIDTGSKPQTHIIPNLQISRLALNLPSLLAKNASMPKLWIYPASNNNLFEEDTRAGTFITLSGDLTLLNENNESPYDSINLSNPLSNVPFLYLCDNESPKIDTTNFNIYAINQTTHYGYQGVWDPYWMEYSVTVTSPSSINGVNKLHRMLFANWLPTGYIPDPRNVTHFTANALWSTAYNILPYLYSAPFKSSMLQMQGKAIRTMHRQQSKNGIPGFNVNTRGYQASLASSASLSNHQLMLQFGQDFSHTKEKDSLNRIASKGYTLALQFLSSWHDDEISTAAKTAYSYGTHRLHNIYTDDSPAYSIGDFTTQTLGASISTQMPISMPQLSTFIYPFVELKGVHSRFSTFSEKGPFKQVLRSFLVEHPLINIFSSLGLAFSPLVTPERVDWSASIAYQPTIYRQKAKVRTVLLSSQGSWNVHGCSPEKHAIHTQFHFTFSPMSHLHIEAEYKGLFATSTTNHFITAGCSLYF